MSAPAWDDVWGLDDPLWCEECEDEICPACGGCNCPGRECSGIHNGDGDDR